MNLVLFLHSEHTQPGAQHFFRSSTGSESSLGVLFTVFIGNSELGFGKGAWDTQINYKLDNLRTLSFWLHFITAGGTSQTKCANAAGDLYSLKSQKLHTVTFL